MPDIQVISQQTTPPGIYMRQTLLDQLSAWKTALISAGVFMKLFVNNFIVSSLAQLTDLTEASAPGYAPFAVTTIDGPYLDQSGNAYMSTLLANFTCSGGGGDLCYGAYLVETTGAAATATFTGSGGGYDTPTITSGGSGYLVPPKVTPTGAGGSGAVITATITGGVVTALTVVSPGTGYTTFLVTIEAPNKLIEAANFATPRPLINSTDAVGVVYELDQLAA